MKDTIKYFPLLILTLILNNFHSINSQTVDYNRLISGIHITGYQGLYNTYENYKEKLLSANISQNLKNFLKSTNPKDDNILLKIDVVYDAETGGKATGELMIHKTENNKIVVEYGKIYGSLPRIEPTLKRECTRVGNYEKCKNILYTPYVDKIKLKDMIHNSMIQKMRNAKKLKLSLLYIPPKRLKDLKPLDRLDRLEPFIHIKPKFLNRTLKPLKIN